MDYTVVSNPTDSWAATINCDEDAAAVLSEALLYFVEKNKNRLHRDHALAFLQFSEDIDIYVTE